MTTFHIHINQVTEQQKLVNNLCGHGLKPD